MVEKIIGVIRDANITRKSGLTQFCDLFFTNEGIVAAITLSKAAKTGFEGWASSGGVVGLWLAKRDRERRRRMFEGKTPDEILHLHRDNFEIRYGDVSSVSLQKSFLVSWIGFVALVEGEEEELVFRFSSKQFGDVERIIRRVLGNKLE